MTIALHLVAFDVPAASEVPKRCTRCGKVYDRAGWDALDFVGDQLIPADQYGPRLLTELRNCSCQSTLAVELEPLPAEARGGCPLSCASGRYLDTTVAPPLWRACGNEHV